jgi:hypothetical protein
MKTHKITITHENAKRLRRLMSLVATVIRPSDALRKGMVGWHAIERQIWGERK